MLLDPIIPIPWIAGIALLAAGLAVYHQVRSSCHLGVKRTAFLLLCRLTALALLIALLLQPSREENVPVPSSEKSVIFALDDSASMAEPHRDGSSRIDAARADLEKSGVLKNTSGRCRFVTFSDGAKPETADSLLLAPADGKITRFDSSIASLIRLDASHAPAGLVILSDGHHFDLVSPGDTARRTRSHDLPIFTVAYGTADSARDLSIRIANYHPHTFVRQKTRLEALLSMIGCPHETVTVELLCDGKPVAKTLVDTGTDSFRPIHFDVSHEEAGEHEYTFRVSPAANEKELSNNSATTFLNVISERIRILEIEGAPFWDSTFLRRSFARNDKFEIDSLVAFTGSRVRPIRSNPERKNEDLKPPASIDDLRPYDLVVLGREVERVIGLDGITLLDTWVKDHGGLVIFARGKAWDGKIKIATELEPIDWSTDSPRGTRLEITPQAGSVPAFKLLREVAEVDEFPEVISFPAEGSPKALAATFSVAGDKSPAVVYRRYGNGQTLSLGVANLWRWVFNPKADYDNNAYDRFWDQLALWLLANGGISPVKGYDLRPDSSNVALGETVRLRFSSHGVEPPAAPPVIAIFKESSPVTSLTPASTGDPNALFTEFTPRETGHYQARAEVGGTRYEAQFIVYREDLESTETAMDSGYLDQLAKASGGRMIDPSEISSLVADLLRDAAEQPPLVRRIPLWDHGWVFWLIGLLFALEWYARRRWGLT
ncbi:MAG: hypothetical protein CFE26_03810 [Verrucomicrobiales bacterium VVV1]|nr:MAG: hypothetical protein CFE26_03810 [Verrucomicrobiales bacterium VVV1]